MSQKVIRYDIERRDEKMISMKCSHNEKFSLPENDEELFSGKSHEEIIRIQSHINDYPDCRLEIAE